MLAWKNFFNFILSLLKAFLKSSMEECWMRFFPRPLRQESTDWFSLLLLWSQPVICLLNPFPINTCSFLCSCFYFSSKELLITPISLPFMIIYPLSNSKVKWLGTLPQTASAKLSFAILSTIVKWMISHHSHKFCSPWRGEGYQNYKSLKIHLRTLLLNQLKSKFLKNKVQNSIYSRH